MIWHMGLTGLLHQRFDSAGRPLIGILTSPIYGWGDLVRLGPGCLLRHCRSTLLPIAGALTPTVALRRHLACSGLRALVVQTETMAAQLRARGLWDATPAVIPPGVDDCWHQGSAEAVIRRRAELGFEKDDYVVVYFGSPAPLRGLPTLIQALALALPRQPRLRLLVLSRRRPGELTREAARLDALIRSAGAAPHVRIVDGALRPAALIEHVAVADLVALPFKLVLSDAPLTIGETLALGKPVLTTRVACLPELAAAGRHMLVPPGDVDALSAALVRAAADCPHGTSPGARSGPTPEPRPWATAIRAWSHLVEGL
jgi:glycosyltransferase involved in cell wall biosynthesis